MSSIEQSTIHWPPEFEPSKCSVHVRNELEIAAPASRVWSWIVHAHLWPTYYDNSHNVTFLTDTESSTLRLNTRFTWKTFGVDLVSEVREFVENERIAWVARGSLGLHVYHAWLIIPRDQNNSFVITEETQNGFLARVGNLFRPDNMSNQHQHWLEQIKLKSLEGPPSTTTN
jgi:hypothetical protein